MPKVVSILFGGFFTAFAAWCLGRVVLRRLRLKMAREEDFLLALPVGAAFYGLLILGLGFAKWIYDPVLLGLGLVVIGRSWKLGAFRPVEERLPALPRTWRYLFWTAYAVFAVVCVIYATAPEMSPDGSGYHLGEVRRYYAEHGFIKITWNMYANLSQGLELLFLNAWAFGRHSAAALVHCAFLLTAPLLILRFGQRVGHPGAGAAAGILFFTTPMVMLDGASAYNDVAVAATIFAVFYVLELSRESESPGWAVLTGILAGFGYALKYTAFLACFYAAARLALRRRWRAIAIVSAVAAVFVLPWVVRNYVWYGNPLSPFFNKWFPNPYIHISFEQDYTRMMRHYDGLKSYWDLPLELTVRGRILGGMLGPLWLLAPLGLFALRSALGRRVLAAGAVFLLPYAANVGTRFTIPALPFLGLAMALAIPAAASRFVLPVLALCAAILGFPDMPAYYTGQEGGWRIQRIPLRQALRIESEHSWLNYKWPDYRIMWMIERATQADAKIYSLRGLPESYTSREVWVSYQSAQAAILRDALYAALYEDAQVNSSLSFRFQAERLTALRVVQTARDTEPPTHDIWSVAELRVLSGGNELERSANWRMTSRPNPWDIQLAFDNWQATRWKAWQWIEPAMYIEVDFGGAATVDEVRLEASTDQWTVKLALMGRMEDGRWKELVKEPVRTGMPPPLGLRRAATVMLKRAGLTHLLVTEGDFEYADFREKRELWGIQEAGAVDGAWLFRIE